MDEGQMSNDLPDDLDRLYSKLEWENPRPNLSARVMARIQMARQTQRVSAVFSMLALLALGIFAFALGRGMTLSGGPRARLAIARAFVRNAPILVLDEATASLDSTAELEVQTEIDRLEENRTVISIAHRLSTLANMDHIIVLSQGSVVEQGTFDELVRAKGIFASMAAKQGIFAMA